MYRITVTADGTTATAANNCRTIKDAESIKAKLAQLLKMPVQIDIIRIGSKR